MALAGWAATASRASTGCNASWPPAASRLIPFKTCSHLAQHAAAQELGKLGNGVVCRFPAHWHSGHIGPRPMLP